MLFPYRTRARRNSRRGAIAFLVAFLLVGLLACLAICVDGGGLLERRRHAQAAADAAAMAAAESLFCSYPQDRGQDVNGTAAKAAYAAAALNGFSNDGATSVVNVRTSPQTYSGGPNAGKPLPSWRIYLSRRSSRSLMSRTV